MEKLNNISGILNNSLNIVVMLFSNKDIFTSETIAIIIVFLIVLFYFYFVFILIKKNRSYCNKSDKSDKK